MTWLAITLVVVLVSYIWMNPPPNPVESAGMLSPEDSADYPVQTVLITKQETMTITRDSDGSRAKAFLVAEKSGKPH